MNDIDQLLRELRDTAPASPRLTWYGRAGERVELSGKVLDNWAAKTANFLTEEIETEPGDRIVLAMPPHWKTLCIALGALAAGASLEPSPSPAPAPLASLLDSRSDPSEKPPLVITTDPALFTDTSASETAPGFTVIAVALPALALSWNGPLAPGHRDFAREIRMFADIFERFEDPTAKTPALPGITYAGLKEWAVSGRLAQALARERASGSSAPGSPRGAICSENLESENPLLTLLQQALMLWWLGGSVVLFEDRATMTPAAVTAERARQL